MPPKNNVSEKRRNQILDAAMKTFSEVGFHKARMSDIADTSGLSKGSLYWYFDSKDSIILNLLEKFFEPELKDLRALLTDNRSAEDRLEIYIDRVSDDMLAMLKWMPLIHDFIALAFRKEPVRKAISSYYQRHLEILLSLIQQGLDAGEFQADSAMEASIAIGSIIEGTVLLWVYDPSQIDIKYHIKSNINLLLQGLRTKSVTADQSADQN
ncbi:MAG: TetR/AcrR family transcriptional regulator [Anaerolineales bacterium]|nr:TetR/AcrR family transcriptional regulator [Anaerolineales bacterium]